MEHLICGHCIFWNEIDAIHNMTIGAPKTGECFGAPPQVVPVINSGQVVGGVNIRPRTTIDTIACAMYCDETDAEPANDPH